MSPHEIERKLVLKEIQRALGRLEDLTAEFRKLALEMSEPNYDNISALRIGQEFLPDAVRKIPKPSNALRDAWIPQTVTDQVWIMFEFANVNERLAWEQRLPEPFKACLYRKIIPEALKFGWATRDANGFPWNENDEP